MQPAVRWLYPRVRLMPLPPGMDELLTADVNMAPQRSKSNLQELKTHVSAIEADFLEGPKFSAWTPILETMIEQIAAEKHLDLRQEDGRGQIANLLVGMLSTSQRKYASDLNTLIPLLEDDIPIHEDYEMLHAEEQKKELGEMILNLIKKFAEQRDVVVTLHLKTGTETRKKVDATSWSLALTFAKWLKKRALLAKTLRQTNLRSLILCITSSPLVEQDHMPLDQIELLQMAEESGTALQLKPFDRHTRELYVVEVLKQEHRYQLSLGQTKRQLLDFVSDYASGMPKYVADLLRELLDQEAISIKQLDLKQGGMRAIQIEKDLLKNYSTETFDSANLGKIIKFPKKMVNAALSKYERLDPTKKEILKLASVCNHFSVQMLRELMAVNVRSVQARGSFVAVNASSMYSANSDQIMGPDPTDGPLLNDTSVSQLDGELAELIKLSVLDALPGVDAVQYIQMHDPQAKGGFTFQCKLMQNEVKKLLTQGNRDMWLERLADMKEEATQHKQNFLRQQTQQVVPISLRESAMFRAQTMAPGANGRRPSLSQMDDFEEMTRYYTEEADTIMFGNGHAAEHHLVVHQAMQNFEDIVEDLVGELQSVVKEPAESKALATHKESIQKFKTESITVMNTALALIRSEGAARQDSALSYIDIEG